MNEVIAEIRNKLQASLSVISALADGTKPSSKAVKIAKKDLESVIKAIDALEKG